MDSIEDVAWRLVFSRLVASGPKIVQQNGSLVATTKLKGHVLSLGAASRRLRVDARAKVVHFTVRNWWFRTCTRHISFDEIERIQYSYHDMSVGFWAYQGQDLFCIGLRLKTGEEIVLFRFFGEGDFVNASPFPDWMFIGDRLVARVTKGSQEDDSLRFADLLGALLGVPVVTPDT